MTSWQIGLMLVGSLMGGAMLGVGAMALFSATGKDDDSLNCFPVQLDDDSLLDPAIATFAIGLTHYKPARITNCIEVLIRPTNVTTDESGHHPGETFVQASFTREEVAAMLKALNEDWADHVRFNGNNGQSRAAFNGAAA